MKIDNATLDSLTTVMNTADDIYIDHSTLDRCLITVMKYSAEASDRSCLSPEEPTNTKCIVGLTIHKRIKKTTYLSSWEAC